jgi:hypothetical protein
VPWAFIFEKVDAHDKGKKEASITQFAAIKTNSCVKKTKKTRPPFFFNKIAVYLWRKPTAIYEKPLLFVCSRLTISAQTQILVL